MKIYKLTETKGKFNSDTKVDEIKWYLVGRYIILQCLIWLGL